MTVKTLTIPNPSLVVMVGGDADSRMAVARKHFLLEEIVSIVGDDNEKTVIDRLTAKSMVVIEAENLTFVDRLRWYSLAKAQNMACVAIVIAPPTATQKDALTRAKRSLRRGEGVFAHAVVESPLLDDLEIVRVSLPVDKRTDSGPFDVIGDVHGCGDELEDLLRQLGWSVTWTEDGGARRPTLSHPEGRKLVFAGDLVDRGPRSLDALLFAEEAVTSGVGYAVMGNHDERLLRWLRGHRVDETFGFAETLAEFHDLPKAVLDRFKAFLETLPSHLVFDGGDLIVAHAGLEDGMALGMSPKVRQFAVFGPMWTNKNGETKRIDWAAKYQGAATIIYGHLAQETAVWRNETICIDTSCVFGGELSALRWPERELVSVPARRVHHPREHEAKDLPLMTAPGPKA